MDLRFNVSSYWGVSRVEKKRVVPYFFQLTCSVSRICLFLSLFLIFCFGGQNVYAEDFAAAIHSIHPVQLDHAGDHVIEVQGKHLNQISRIVLTQSLPYIKSTLSPSSIGEVTGLDFQDPYVYAITDYSKISIINISDPNSPELINTLNVFSQDSFLRDVQVLDNYLFITDTPKNGLWVLDISNPTSPELINLDGKPATTFALFSEDLSPSIYAIYVEPETENEYTIYLTSWKDGLLIYSWDAMNPPVKKYPKPGQPYHPSKFLSIPRNLDIKLNPLTGEHYIYIADSDSVEVFKKKGDSVSRIGDPNATLLDNTFFKEDPNNPYHPDIRDVKVKNEYLYVVDRQYGLYVVNINDPNSPQISDRLSLALERRSIAIQSNLAVVAAVEYGLDLIDVSLPSTPVFMHHISSQGIANFTHIDFNHGKFILIANGNSGFAIADVETLMDFPSLGHLDVKGNILNLTVSENRAYVSAGESGLKVVDIENPWNPHLICSFPKVAPTGNDDYIKVSDCCLYYDGLYVANDTFLLTFDNSGECPSRKTETSIGDPIQSITVKDKYLFTLKLTKGLQIFEIDTSADFDSEDHLSDCGGFSSSSTGYYQNVRIGQNSEGDVIAYLADGSEYLWGVDVTDPSAPQEIFYKSADPDLGGSLGLSFIDIGVNGDYAYWINGSYNSDNSVVIVKANEENGYPDIINSVKISKESLVACSIWKDFLYVAGTFYGVQILDVSDPLFPTILDSIAIPRVVSSVLATQEKIYIGEQTDMLHIYSAPRSLSLLDLLDPNIILDPQNQDRDPNEVNFRIPEGLPSGFYDLIFLSEERQKIRKYRALQINKYATLDLKKGLTLFGYPGKVPAEFIKSYDLIKGIDPSSSGILLSDRQEYPPKNSYWKSGELSGFNFTIEDNQGYVLYLKEDKSSVYFPTSYYFPLEVIVYHLGQRLKEGAIHWISFPVKDEQREAAFDILEKLKEFPDVKNSLKLQKRDTLSGKWTSTYDFFSRQCGHNFLIQKGEGYLLYGHD